MTLAAADLSMYLPIGILVLMAIAFAVGNVALSRMLGPQRQGSVKALVYESGMNPVTSARKRFNVRFYIVAMVFLVFDVEIIFLYPWAATFAQMEARSAEALTFLIRVFFFLFTTVVAFLYAYRKGVFRFE